MASTGILRGRVTRADTGAPIPRATVTLTSSALGETRTVPTDEDGRFEFTGLPPGDYRLGVLKTGFARTVYGPPGTEVFSPSLIGLVDGQTIEHLNLAMPLGAVVEGRVVDQSGEPIADAAVELRQPRMKDGQTRLLNIDVAKGTDDRGHFRFWNVPAGTYFLASGTSAHIGPHMSRGSMFGLLDGQVPTFYPGTTVEKDAQPVIVGEGQILTDLTITIAAASLARITGTVTSPTGASFERGMVSLSRRGQDSRKLLLGSEKALRADGVFVFSDVIPGSYVVAVRLHHGEGAFACVDLTQGDCNVMLVTSGTSTLRGRVRFESGPPAGIEPETVRASVEAKDGVPVSMDRRFPTLRADWTFAIPALLGEYELHLVVDGFMLGSVRRDGTTLPKYRVHLDGRDVDVDLLMVNSDASVSGRVHDGAGDAVAGAAVFVCASDPTRHRYRGVRVNQTTSSGRFQIGEMPAGEYYAFALKKATRDEILNPELLETWRARGTPLTLTDAEEKTLDLAVME
jgi:protocatechuate 3,4-dioxygenase beta subunit